MSEFQVLRQMLVSLVPYHYPAQDPDGSKTAKARDRAVRRFDDALATLQAALAANGDITNPVYKDLKTALNRVFDDAWDEAKLTPPGYFYQQDLKDKFSDDEINLIFNVSHPGPQLHTYQSTAKKLAKLPASYAPRATMLALLAEIEPLCRAVAGLTVVKRQPKPVEDVKAKYIAPRASGSATALVQQALMQITQDSYNGLLKQFMLRSHQSVAAYGQAIAEARAAGTRVPSPYGHFVSKKQYPNHEACDICQQVFDARGLLAPDKDAIIERLDRRAADHIRELFIIKNLKKLDSIVEAKGNLAGVDVLGYKLGLGSLEGRLRIRFTDGSDFAVQNMVVWGTSVHGKSFNRFPLTFHDVTMPDGSKMARPSQERMNTVFLGLGQAAA